MSNGAMPATQLELNKYVVNITSPSKIQASLLPGTWNEMATCH